MKNLCLLFTAFLFLQLTLLPQSNLDSNITFHSFYPMGPCHSGYILDNYAYISFGVGMDILDVSAENFYTTIIPRKIGRISWDKYVKVKKVEGDYAYLVNKDNELVIVDIRNPYYPLEVNSFYIGEGVYSIFYDGDVFISNSSAYVYTKDSTLTIFNVIDPQNPVELGSYPLNYRLRSYFVAGDYLYAISFENLSDYNSLSVLHILNTSDPANITEVGYLDFIDVTINDVFVLNNYAYLAAWGQDTSAAPIRIVDVSDPTSPVQIGVIYDDYGAKNIFVQGNYAYLSPVQVGGFETSLYPTKIYIADVSVPTNPFKVSDFTLSGEKELFQAVDNYAYLCGTGLSIQGGLTILDINNPLAPVFAGYYDTGYEFDNINVLDNYLYVTSGWSKIIGGFQDRSNLKVFDVSNKTNPKEISSFLLEHLPITFTIASNYAFAISQDINGNNFMEVISIDNPGYPQPVGLFQSDSTYFFDIKVLDDYAFVLGGGSGDPNTIVVFDVSNPSLPEVISVYSILNYMEWSGKLFLSNSFLYIFTGYGSGSRTLIVINVTDPLNLTLAGTFDTESNDYAQGLFVKDNLAYFLQDSLLKIVDVSDPASIVNISSYYLGVPGGAIYVEDVFAYITNWDGIKIINVANLSNPREVGFWNSSGNLVVKNKIIHLLRGGMTGGGLYILENDIATSVFTHSKVPVEYYLSNNYPNPFNPSTKIKYSVPQTSQVQIKVFDVLGNEIETLVNEEKSVGNFELTWNAEGLPSGVYFYQLKAGQFIETKKMLLLK